MRFFLISISFFISACGSSSNTQAPQCVETNCHGSTVTCGFGEQMACTEEYVFGDLCRAFVRCEVINENCIPVENEKYSQCLSCLSSCESRNDIDLSSCDYNCRTSLEN